MLTALLANERGRTHVLALDPPCVAVCPSLYANMRLAWRSWPDVLDALANAKDDGDFPAVPPKLLDALPTLKSRALPWLAHQLAQRNLESVAAPRAFADLDVWIVASRETHDHSPLTPRSQR